LKTKEFTPPQADDCFQNENNAVFGVFLQRLYSKPSLVIGVAFFLWRPGALSVIVASYQLCFSKQAVGFLRQPPVANKNAIGISASCHSNCCRKSR